MFQRTIGLKLALLAVAALVINPAKASVTVDLDILPFNSSTGDGTQFLFNADLSPYGYQALPLDGEPTSLTASIPSGISMRVEIQDLNHLKYSLYNPLTFIPTIAPVGPADLRMPGLPGSPQTPAPAQFAGVVKIAGSTVGNFAVRDVALSGPINERNAGYSTWNSITGQIGSVDPVTLLYGASVDVPLGTTVSRNTTGVVVVENTSITPATFKPLNANVWELKIPFVYGLDTAPFQTRGELQGTIIARTSGSVTLSNVFDPTSPISALGGKATIQLPSSASVGLLGVETKPIGTLKSNALSKIGDDNFALVLPADPQSLLGELGVTAGVKAYEINYAGALNGLATVRLDYSELLPFFSLSGKSESSLEVWHFDDALGNWVKLSRTIDSVTKIVSFQSNSFSPFVLAPTGAAIPEASALALVVAGAVGMIARRMRPSK